MSDDIRVRICRPGDRAALLALGHPPGVTQAFCPSLLRRFEWWLAGNRIVNQVAVEGADERVVGSVQLIRTRRDPRTWLFGHWRVPGPRRRQGLGRLLLAEALRQVPEISRLYSFVDWGNDISTLAHERLGFRRSAELRGSAPLGALSTIGAAAPAVRLTRVRRGESAGLFALYSRAMGEGWLSLFPRLGPHNFLDSSAGEMVPWLVRAARVIQRPTGLYRVDAGGVLRGFVRRDGPTLELFADPDSCDASLLARVALRLMDLGEDRETRLLLRGLTREIVSRPGPIDALLLMVLGDRTRLNGAPPPPSPSAGRR